MSTRINRRQFLHGDLANRRPALRPPWALEGDAFYARCERCGQCISACETGVLVSGDGRYPQPDFHLGGCSFCGRCVTACTAGALVRGGRPPWTLKARISDSCLAGRGITCQVCADHCPVRALRFPPRLAPAVAAPVLDAAACNGCGACVAPCPVRAIGLLAPVA